MTTNRRLWALGMALLLAALATAALLSYVKGVERKTLDGAQSVSVLVARDEIAAGTTAASASANGLIGRAAVPSRLVPEGAITALDQIEGKVAAFAIRKGEQLVAGRFVEPAKLTGTLPIPADRQAMSVEVDVPAGVGGFVQPGNQISLIAKFDVEFSNGAKAAVARYIVQNVPVLAVGARVLAVPGSSRSGDDEQAAETESSDRVQLTLALLPADAEKVTLAIYNGELHATLLPPGQKPVTTPGRSATNIFN